MAGYWSMCKGARHSEKTCSAHSMLWLDGGMQALQEPHMLSMRIGPEASSKCAPTCIRMASSSALQGRFLSLAFLCVRIVAVCLSSSYCRECKSALPATHACNALSLLARISMVPVTCRKLTPEKIQRRSHRTGACLILGYCFPGAVQLRHNERDRLLPCTTQTQPSS